VPLPVFPLSPKLLESGKQAGRNQPGDQMESTTIAKMQKQIDDLKTENKYLQEKVRILTIENVRLMNKPQKNPLRIYSKEQEDE